MARPLLPADRVGREEPATWSAATGKHGIFEISRAEMMGNLIWPSGIVPAAVSHPLAAAEAFRWLLELNDDRAVRLLKLLLQAQFLGAIAHEDLNLSEGAVGRVLRTATQAERVTIWRPVSDRVGRAPVAGSLGTTSEYPLFPSARLLASKDAYLSFARALAGMHDVDIDSAGSLRLETDANDRFRGSLARLRLMLPPESPWRAALSTIAAGAAPAPSFPLTSGLIPADVSRDRWECPAHVHDARSWLDDCGGNTIVLSADTTELRCPKHPLVSIQDSSGQAITVERLGAGVLAARDSKQLVIWSDVLRHPHGLNVSVSRTELSFDYWRNGGPRIVLKGKVLTLPEVLSESWPLTPSGPDAPAATLGLKSEFLPLLDSVRWESVSSCWSAHLKGRPDLMQFSRPSTTHSPDPRSGVVVWPRLLPQSAWAAEMVAAAFRFGPEEAALVTRTPEHGKLFVAPFLKLPWGLPSDGGQVQFVALRLADGRELGVIPIERKSSENQTDSIGYVAIDFGTSNTVVGFKGAHDEHLTFVERGVRAAETDSVYYGAGQHFAEDLDQLLIIFSRWYRESDSLPMFGSLYYEKDGGKRGFSILPLKTDLFKRLSGGSDRLHTDLKWGDPNGPAIHRLSRYLERALLPALHQLRLRGCGAVTVAATYPLAFDLTRYGRFQRALNGALERLSEQTGVTLAPARLVSESIAGIAQVSGGIANYTLTIDLGGGTTDLALVTADGVPLAVDSLQIGGRALLEAVLNRAVGRDREKLQRDLPPEASGIKGPVWLEAVLQEGPEALRIDLATAVSQGAVRQAVAALFAGIVVAAARLLEAAMAQPGAIVNLVLLGQGWELLGKRVLGAFDEQWFIQALQRRVNGNFDLRLAAATAGRDRKLALVRGAMRLLVNDQANAIEHVQPPTYLYMDLHRQNGAKYRHADSVRAVITPDFAEGDPGFTSIVEELRSVMSAMSGQGRELGDMDARFNTLGPNGTTLIQDLVHHAVGMLSIDLASGDGLRASPLMRFLDGPWRRHWSAGVASVEVSEAHG